jgi:hypothetical protein
MKTTNNSKSQKAVIKGNVKINPINRIETKPYIPNTNQLFTTSNYELP